MFKLLMAIAAVSFIAIIIGVVSFMMQMTVSALTQYTSLSTSFMNNIIATNAILLENQSIINNFKTRSIFVNTSIECQNTIDVDPGSTVFNNKSIECVEELLKRCELTDFHLLYGLGSMIVSIQGKENSFCSINIEHEIEMGEKRFSCLVPLDKIANWSSWKNSNGLTAVNDILSFCSSLE